MRRLITDAEKEKLCRNWNDEADHLPVVKIFAPNAAATWLLTAMDPTDGNTMFGLCDLGLGCPETGLVTLQELESVSIPIVPGANFNIGLEKDEYFTPRYRLSVYAAAANRQGSITEDEQILNRVQEEMNGKK